MTRWRTARGQLEANGTSHNRVEQAMTVYWLCRACRMRRSQQDREIHDKKFCRAGSLTSGILLGQPVQPMGSSVPVHHSVRPIGWTNHTSKAYSPSSSALSSAAFAALHSSISDNARSHWPARPQVCTTRKYVMSGTADKRFAKRQGSQFRHACDGTNQQELWQCG